MTAAPATLASPAAPTKRVATYADVLAAPEHVVAEILAGELVTHPRPAPKHAVAAVALARELSGPLLGGPGRDGWVFMVEPELHLDADVVVPDLAAWRRERLPQLPETAYLELPPDWVCEIISPSTEKWDRVAKRDIYARAKIPYLWLVDPTTRFIEAFALTERGWLLLATAAEDPLVTLAPFEAVAFPLAALWPFDPPPSP